MSKHRLQLKSQQKVQQAEVVETFPEIEQKSPIKHISVPFKLYRPQTQTNLLVSNLMKVRHSGNFVRSTSVLAQTALRVRHNAAKAALVQKTQNYTTLKNFVPGLNQESNLAKKGKRRRNCGLLQSNILTCFTSLKSSEISAAVRHSVSPQTSKNKTSKELLK